MTRSVLKHQEDDGDLSIFASGNVVVLACEYGHYWVLDAQERSIETVKPALEEALSVDQFESLLKVM